MGKTYLAFDDEGVFYGILNLNGHNAPEDLILLPVDTTWNLFEELGKLDKNYLTGIFE